jgi:putative transposase
VAGIDKLAILNQMGKMPNGAPSYFVSSVGGAPLEVLKCYIRDQEKPS